MKKLIYTLVVLAFTVSLNAQWESDVRLTNDTSVSFIEQNNWSIAADNNYVHAVWFDLRNNNNTGNWEIYYKRSTNSGVSWGTDTRLTNDTSSWSPAIAVSGLTVHIVWWKMDNPGIYYKRSTDGGATWGAENRLTTYSVWQPSIAVSGSNVHIVYEMGFSVGNEIMYKRSTDGGTTWGADTRLTNDSIHSRYPSIAVSGNNLHIVWDTRDSKNEINYKRSTDGGNTWGADTRLSNDSVTAYASSIAVSGNNVHVAWQEANEIYYKRSTNGGTSWGAVTRLTNDIYISKQPSIVVSGTQVHVVWYDNRDLNYEIYYKRSTNDGSSWGADTRLTDDFSYSSYPSIALSNSNVHVLWMDERDNNKEIYYKRNPTGNVGVQNISTEIPTGYKLHQNYPNPFNPTTIIKFDVAHVGYVKITVYDAMGREIVTLINEQLQAGTYETDWNASSFSSGVYFYKIVAGNYTETRKMILMK